jgi:hypothetical protein
MPPEDCDLIFDHRHNAAMSVHWTNVGELPKSRTASAPLIVAADRNSGHCGPRNAISVA